jgi:hypothetical protein
VTTFSNAATTSTTLTIASLSSITAGSYSATSSLVDNTATTMSYLRGLVRLSFSAALTAGSGAPYITVYRHVAANGTQLPNPPGSSAAAPSANALQSIRILVASGSYQYLDFGPFDMDPFQYGFQVYNNSGVAFSGTVTATLYRWNVQGA